MQFVKYLLDSYRSRFVAQRYLSLVVVIILFQGITCELGGFTSDINNKKKVNISSFFTTANSVENNSGFSSLNSFLSTLKIIS
jgi:hypothetical protein